MKQSIKIFSIVSVLLALALLFGAIPTSIFVSAAVETAETVETVQMSEGDIQPLADGKTITPLTTMMYYVHGSYTTSGGVFPLRKGTDLTLLGDAAFCSQHDKPTPYNGVEMTYDGRLSDYLGDDLTEGLTALWAYRVIKAAQSLMNNSEYSALTIYQKLQAIQIAINYPEKLHSSYSNGVEGGSYTATQAKQMYALYAAIDTAARASNLQLPTETPLTYTRTGGDYFSGSNYVIATYRLNYSGVTARSVSSSPDVTCSVSGTTLTVSIPADKIQSGWSAIYYGISAAAPTQTIGTIDLYAEGTGKRQKLLLYDEYNYSPTAGISGTIQFANGGVEIRKVDEADTNKGLAGAIFRITNNDTGWSDDFPATDSSGYTRYTDNLPIGRYTIKEKTPPAGYALSNWSQDFEITASSTTTLRYTVTNPAKTGSWTPTATKLLEGADLTEGQFTFILSEKGKEIQRTTNKADGTVTFEQIKYTPDDIGEHTYTITELNGGAPDITYDSHTLTYVVTVSNTQSDGLLVFVAANGSTTFTNSADKGTGVTVTKVWDDNNNQDGLRADVHLTLTGSDGSSYKGTIKLGESSYMWNDLHMYKNGELIVYTLSEAAIEGYDSEIAEDGYSFIVTNSHTPEKTSYTVHKKWLDNGDQDRVRPTRITVTIKGSDGKTYTESFDGSGDDWSYTFTDLPKYHDNGKLITYMVESENAVPGYSSSIDGDTITNTHEPDDTTFTVSKRWVDNSDQDGIRPSEITVTIRGSDGETYTHTFDGEGDSWSYTFTDLPKYADGELITYSIVSENAVPGYSSSINGDTITNTHTPEETDFTVYKKWIDNSDQDGIRPSEITVTIHGSDGKTYTHTFSGEGDSWFYTFTDLPKFADGELITYSIVSENAVEGYISSIHGDTVTNTHTPEETDFTVYKKWIDNSDQDGIRPSVITVTIRGSDGKTYIHTFDGEGDSWSYTFTGLPKYADGGLITYTIVDEADVDGYASSIEDNTIINEHTPEETTFTVYKRWDDEDNQDGIRPSDITVTIRGSDVKTYTATIDGSGNDWSYTFTGLPKFADGEPITYTIVDEADVDGYASSIKDNTIINEHTPEEIEITIHKIWKDDANYWKLRPDGIKLTLTGSDGSVRTVTLTGEDDSWSYTFNNLPKYSHGVEIIYTVSEESVVGYSTAVDGYTITNTLLKWSLKIVKIDADSGKTIPYSGAGFELYRPDGSKVILPDGQDVFYTGEDGSLTLYEMLPYGKGYSLKEVQAPYGYVLDSTPVFFDLTGELTTVTVTKSDRAQKGVIRIQKTGEVFSSVVESDGMYQPVYERKGLAGAVFQIIAAEDIYTPDGTLRYAKGMIVDTVKTGESGWTVSKYLYLGKFEVREIQAPHGMVLNRDSVIVELIYSGQEVQITESSASFYNERQKAAVTLTKIMEQDTDFQIGMNDKILSVRFGLFAAENLTAADGSVISKDGLIEIISCYPDGYAIFQTDIPVGAKLYVKEIAVDSHYVLSDTRYSVGFDYAEQDTVLVKIEVNGGEEIVNEILYGTVKGLKIDRETGKSISGALFGLFRPDELFYTEDTVILIAESDLNGIFTFDNVPYGDWIIVELKPAEGYLPCSDIHHIQINTDGQIIRITAVNDHIPEIGTTATAEGEKQAHPNDTLTIEDVVEYKHLIPGKAYTLKGVLMDKATGLPFLVNGQEIHSEITFVPESPSGAVVISFTFDASGIMENTEIVVFEALYKDGIKLTVHADIDDEGQTVTVLVPEIGTQASVDGEKEVNATEVYALEDMVSYENLILGREYTIKGILMDKATGMPLLIDGNVVCSEITFIPEESCGEVTVTFTFDSKFIQADTDIVVFESLYKDSLELAVHADIDNEGQTVTVRVPEIGTQAAIGGEKTAEASGDITIEDTVSYKNLTPGKEYTIYGVLMNKSTGEPFLVNGEEIHSEITFVPETSDGEVIVTFTFNADGITLETDVVVFETLTRDGVEIAVHADIEDEGQTVILLSLPPDVPQTGDEGNLSFWIGLGAIALGTFASVIVVYFIRKNDEDE